MKELFVPEKLKVGFKKREATVDGNLSYVIYYDEKGKLRKETSWNSWRDKRIDPLDLDNKPMKGFIINKSIEGYSHDFGSVDAKIRIYDPRGFEFEISVANLVGIINQSNIMMTEIEVECVFAWSGKDLVLLPTNSEQYKVSLKHTEKQSQKVSAKDLKIGAIYSVKKSDQKYIYIGKYIVSTLFMNNLNFYMPCSKTKDFVFKNLVNGEYVTLAVSVLAECLQEEPVDDIHEYIDIFERSKMNRYAVKIEIDENFNACEVASNKDYILGMIEKIDDEDVLSYSRIIAENPTSFIGNKVRIHFNHIAYAKMTGTILKRLNTRYNGKLDGSVFSNERIKGRQYPECEKSAVNKYEILLEHVKNLGVGLIKVHYSDGTSEYLKQDSK